MTNIKVYQDGPDFYAEGNEVEADRLVWSAPEGTVKGDDDVVGASAARRQFESFARSKGLTWEFVS